MLSLYVHRHFYAIRLWCHYAASLGNMYRGIWNCKIFGYLLCSLKKPNGSVIMWMAFSHLDYIWDLLYLIPVFVLQKGEPWCNSERLLLLDILSNGTTCLLGGHNLILQVYCDRLKFSSDKLHLCINLQF